MADEVQEGAQALEGKLQKVRVEAATGGATATKNYVLWDWFYEPGLVVDTPRKRAGVTAMKNELIFNGYKGGIIVSVQAWGDAVTKRTKEFQEAEGLLADGVIGRTTARHLFRSRAAIVETQLGIPDNLTSRQKSWESQNDPVCLGISQDEGIGQISPPNHPEISIAQMWDPAFAIPWMAGALKGAFLQLNDWDGALAAYNVGRSLAKSWVIAGKPQTGGPEIGKNPDGSPLFAWDRCYSYSQNVRKTLF